MVVEWDAREMGAAAARGRGKERDGERRITSIFLSTNLKFEAFLEGEEEFSGPGQARKGHYCVHPVLVMA